MKNRKTGAQRMKRKRQAQETTPSRPAVTTPRIEPKSTPRMTLTKEVERMEAPAKKTSRMMFSGTPRSQQQQQQPSAGTSRESAVIDYEALMRKQEAQLSRFRKGSNSYKVEVGKIRAECGRMAAEATRKAKEEKKRGEGDVRRVLEERKMKKRIEIEVKKKEEDKKVAVDRKKEDAKNERMRMNVVGEENKLVKEKTEREIIEAQKWRDEREQRMKARRWKEHKERQEKYLKDIEDLPPLEPLKDLVNDGQVPGTSGYRSTITWTIVRTLSWERDASDEWDEKEWEKTVESIASRPEFGEREGGKGKGGETLVKKGEVVKFGTVMNRKEHELFESRR